jgi:hypothetical protein
LECLLKKIQDVVSALPTLISLEALSAAAFIDTMSRECSAKELVIAVQECIEGLRNKLRTEDEEDRTHEVPIGLSAPQQVVRLLGVYSNGQ